ncbi:hypothetical protein [Catenulispora subtropica]|uniref:Uncharacterized protein n=1 Tax=Catenulispora subtropica TaxID=450798 RepID=A0ABN2SNP0_9ACTN
MSEILERRYRRLLRMLPKHYRQSRGEELLGALMEGAGEQRRWPEAREALSLAGLSARTRFRAAGADGGEHRASRFGETARAIAFLGAAVLALNGVNEAVMVKLYRHTLFTGWPEPHRRKDNTWELRYSVLTTLHRELPALWLLIFALVTVGWWSAARLLALGELVFAATDLDTKADMAREQLLLVAVTTLAVLLARGAAARRVRGGWLVPAGGVAAVALGVFALALRDPRTWVNSNPHRLGQRVFHVLWVGNWMVPDTRVALVLTSAVFLVVAVLGWRSPVWPLATTVVAFATFGSLVVGRFVMQWDYTDMREGGASGAAAVVGGLLAVTLLALIRERRTQRSVEPTPAG